MYPLTLSKTAMISDILSAYVAPAGKIRERGIETGVFANGMVIVNHRSTPYTLPEKFPVELYQYKEHAATKAAMRRCGSARNDNAATGLAREGFSRVCGG